MIHLLVTYSSALLCLGFCLVVLINDMGYPWTHELMNWATPELIPIGQRNMRMELGHVSFAFSPPQAWIKGCDSCVQILAGLAMISICVILSLQELSFSDKWILCRLDKVIHPANHQSRSDDCHHPQIFWQLLLTEQQFEGDLCHVIEQTVPFYRNLAGPCGW